MYKYFTELVDFVGSKPKTFIDTKKYISTGALKTDFISEDDIEIVDYISRPSRADLVVNSGDILFAKMVYTDKRLLVNDVEASHIYSTGFFAVKPKDGILTAKCLYYLLSSETFKNQKDANSTGATQKAITIEGLKKIKLRVPEYNKQDRIGSVLENIERIIKYKQQQLSEYDQLIKSRFVEMFGDPITNDKKWEQVNLKKLAIKIMSGNTPKGGSQVYVNTGIMFFRSQNVWKNKIQIDDIAYIDENTHKKMSRSSLKHKDILMTKTGRINTENSSLGRAAMYLGEDDKANINGHVYMIRLNEIAAKEFVLFIITTNEYRDYIRSVCVGGIDKRQLNKDHIEDFPIILPPRSLQDDFVKFIRQIDKLKFEDDFYQ